VGSLNVQLSYVGFTKTLVLLLTFDILVCHMNSQDTNLDYSCDKPVGRVAGF